jgi:hypothetical protein
VDENLTPRPGPADSGSQIAPAPAATLPSDPPPGIPPTAIPPTAIPLTREYRATVAFSVIAAFAFVVLVLIGSRLSSAAVLGALVAIAVNVIEAFGLRDGRPWARYAMTPMLWIMLVVGLINVVLALSRSTLLVPIDSIVAIWALRARPADALGPLPESSAEGTALVLITLVTGVLTLFGAA